MSDKSDYLENLFITTVLRGGTYTGGDTYVALFTAAPTDAGGGTECSYSGYARQKTHSTTPSSAWTAASGGSTSNTQVLTYGAVAGSSINVVAVAIFDASSGGNMLWWKALGAPIAFNIGDVPSFPVGSIVVTEA